jgi:CopG family transcriptional regulator/antitoxin EndoAI
MKGGQNTINRRLNITLPERTVKMLDRAAPKGNRSRLIDDAIRQYLTTVGRAALRKRLEEGYRRGAEQDLEIAAEWFSAEDGALHKSQK